MMKLSKDNANELNLLFDKMLKWEGETTYGTLNIFEVSNSVEETKGKPDEYIQSLMYLARLEQKKIPELFTGDTLISINRSSIRDFLLQGGFLTIYNEKRAIRLKDGFRFWSIFIITVITLLITIWQFWSQSNERQSLNIENSAGSPPNTQQAQDSILNTRSTRK